MSRLILTCSCFRVDHNFIQISFGAVNLRVGNPYLCAVKTNACNTLLFQPFKFAYCLRLIDAGFIEKAFRYLEVLSNSLSMLLEQEIEEPDLQPIDLRGLFLMASQCLRLAERLCHHPEVGSFEASATSGNCLGGGASVRSYHSSHWIERLRIVCQRMCGAVSHSTQTLKTRVDCVLLDLRTLVEVSLHARLSAIELYHSPCNNDCKVVIHGFIPC